MVGLKKTMVMPLPDSPKKFDDMSILLDTIPHHGQADKRTELIK